MWLSQHKWDPKKIVILLLWYHHVSSVVQPWIIYDYIPHYITPMPSAQAEEVATELKKPSPDPLSSELVEKRKIMQSSLDAAVTEWKNRKGQQETPWMALKQCSHGCAKPVDNMYWTAKTGSQVHWFIEWTSWILLFFNLPDHAAIGYLMQHIYVYNGFDFISFHVHGSLENVSIQIINVAFAVLCLEWAGIFAYMLTTLFPHRSCHLHQNIFQYIFQQS